MARYRTTTQDQFVATHATAATQQLPAANIPFQTTFPTDASPREIENHPLPPAKRPRTDFIPDEQQASLSQKQSVSKATPSKKYNYYLEFATYFHQNDQIPKQTQVDTINDKEIKGKTLYENYRKWVNASKPEPEQYAILFKRSKEG